ncbi:MAG: sensor histidine kinase [Spirochaetaceae bacterium]
MKFSIRSTIIITFSSMLIIVILLMNFSSYYVTGSVVKSITSNNANQAISQLNLVIENYISYMDDMAHVVFSNSSVKDYLNNQNDESYIDNVHEFLSEIISVRSDIESIMIAGDKGEILTDNRDDVINYSLNWKQLNWYSEASSITQRGFITSAHVQNLILDQYNWVISLSREVVDPTSNNKIGVVLVDLNYAVLEELSKNIKLGERGYVFIINDQGEIIYHPRQQLIYSDLKSEKIIEVLENRNSSFNTVIDGEELIYTTISSSETGWTIVGVSYLDELYLSRERVQFIYTLIGIIFFIVLMFISVIISRKISQPIQNLRASMENINKGDFSFSVPEEGHLEVAELAHDFNFAVKKIRELIFEIKKEQEYKRKHELRALQAQINPHFLYNTLDSIIWMIECDENEDAIDMTTALARFFRLGISKGRDIISVRSVTDHIKSYLTIQKLRYKDTLDYEIDVDKEIYEYQTLKLLIQPFVENAIYHGIKTKKGPGSIKIRGYKELNRLVFTVSDNGSGLSEEDIKKLDEVQQPSSGTSGIGIYNVRQRIKLFFGDEYGVTYKSILNEGTVVTISLPIILGGETWVK